MTSTHLSGLSLFLDTTSEVMHLGVWNPSRQDWLFKIEAPQTSQRFHSAMMIPMLNEAFQQNHLAPQDIQALILHEGPGSFTGIRTGLVTGRILAQFLQCPVYSINAFEVMAPLHQACLVMLDALRGNVYCAVLTLSEEDIIYQLEPCILPIETALNNWQKETHQVIVCDSLANKLTDRFLQAKHDVLDKMLWLLQHHAKRLQKPWQEIKPLYLQEPNITQRKPQPGRLV